VGTVNTHPCLSSEGIGNLQLPRDTVIICTNFPVKPFGGHGLLVSYCIMRRKYFETSFNLIGLYLVTSCLLFAATESASDSECLRRTGAWVVHTRGKSEYVGPYTSCCKVSWVHFFALNFYF
jgi:hypothetical protein